MISRREFIAASALLPFGLAARAKKVPVGLELYSVRTELGKNLLGTLDAVGKMGYEAVEFYAPYFEWTTQQAKDVRRQMDHAGIRCSSTHNGEASFTPEGMKKAAELNQILGSGYMLMAGSAPIPDLAGWKALAGRITRITEALKPLGMRSGFHNHENEWARVEGQRPMDVLAANTPREFILQFDVGSCVAAGEDPVAWIKANPGRIKSIHCKDWSRWPWRGYRVLFGDGSCPWQEIFDAAESVGGVEYYLIEQEGSHYGEMDTARRCLENFKRLRS